MILFIVVLSAGHMAAMAPPKVSPTPLAQESASHPMVRAGSAVSDAAANGTARKERSALTGGQSATSLQRYSQPDLTASAM
jgi:hypothetical protein